MPRNTQKSNAKKLHSDRLKQIRPFINFNYDLRAPLTKSAKTKIKRYHDEITALTNRPYQVFRPRKIDHLKEAQAYAQHGAALPGLKVAFLPTDGANRVKLRFTEKGVVAKTKNVLISDVRLSKRQLLINAEAHVNARIQGNPAKQFTIQAGRYEIPRPFLPETVAKGVARLVMQYSDSESNHYFGNWLHGLKAYQFENQGTLAEYLQEKAKHIREAKNDRRRKARNDRRERERKQAGSLGGRQ